MRGVRREELFSAKIAMGIVADVLMRMKMGEETARDVHKTSPTDCVELREEVWGGWGRTYVCAEKPAGESGDVVVPEAFELEWHDGYDYGVDEQVRGDT